MSTLVAIDPGKKSGFSVFLNGRLGALHAVSIDQTTLPYLTPGCLAAIERPKIYPNQNSKADPDDLIQVAINVGRWQQWLLHMGAREVFLVPPRTWKGTVEKTLLHDRIRAGKILGPLDADEMRIALECKSLDAWDALGLGLWKLGRLK